MWVQPSVDQMRANALAGIEQVTGQPPVRTGRGNVETYRTGTGKVFHLRTRYRDPQAGGGIRYYFGLRESCWNSGEFFVLGCDLDFVLVVSVDDWLPHIAQFSLSKDARQPHVIWTPTSNRIELREGSLRIDLDPNRDRFDLLL